MDAILLKQALIGTDRPLTPNSLEESAGRIEVIESLCETRTSDSAAWRLLLKAGCYAVAERTGFEPEIETDSRPKTSMHDDSPAMSSKIVDILFEFLKEYQDQPQVVLHLFRKLEEKRLVFPVETLSRFLDALSQRRIFKEEGLGTISKLLGERGRWLAGKNSDWRWASDHPLDETATDLSELEEIWNEGTFSERKTVLQILAGRDPKSAKRFVAETWKNDKAEHREAFLNLLEKSFDDSDIEFLEASLSDRSKNVRKIVTVCLAHLPNSGFAQRIRKRAERLIHLAGTPAISPPTEFTKDMKADGFEEKPPQGVGPRAWWLIESTKYVPLDFWENLFQMEAAEIISQFRKDDYFEPILHGWTFSAIHLPNSGSWLEPLWDAWDSIKINHLSPTYEIRTQFAKHAILAFPQLFWPKVKTRKQTDNLFVSVLDKAWAELAMTRFPWDEPFVSLLFDYLSWSKDPLLFLAEIVPFFPDFAVLRLRLFLKTLQNHIQPHRLGILQKCEYRIALIEAFEELLIIPPNTASFQSRL